MAKLTGFWAGLALAATLAAPALAEGENAATVVATVNGTEITLGQMIALRENLPPQYLSLPDDVLFNHVALRCAPLASRWRCGCAPSHRRKAGRCSNWPK